MHARLLASALAPYTRHEARDISQTWTHTQRSCFTSSEPNDPVSKPNSHTHSDQSSGLHCSSSTALRAPPNLSCRTSGPVHSCSPATAPMDTNKNVLPRAIANVQRAHAHAPPHMYTTAHVRAHAHVLHTRTSTHTHARTKATTPHARERAR